MANVRGFMLAGALALAGGCGERESLLAATPGREVLAAWPMDPCGDDARLLDAVDALALVGLRDDGRRSATALARQLASVVRSRRAEVEITAQGDGRAMAVGVEILCGGGAAASGGRVSWFEAGSAGWRRAAALTVSAPVAPRVVWADPGRGRLLVATVAPSTQWDVVTIRALAVRGDQLVEIAAVSGLHAVVFVPTTTADGFRFRHQVSLDRFSGALAKEYEETWGFAGDRPAVTRVALTPWLDALEASCGAPIENEPLGCGAAVVSATPKAGGVVEVVLAGVPLPETFGCPVGASLAVTLVMAERAGAWRVIERRPGSACAHDAGR